MQDEPHRAKYVQERPWQMAVACSDRFVRVYDTRRLSLRSPGATGATPALLSLVPLHLCLGSASQHGLLGRAYTTCARFSHRGDKLVATYHGEQVRIEFFVQLLVGKPRCWRTMHESL